MGGKKYGKFARANTGYSEKEGGRPWGGREEATTPIHPLLKCIVSTSVLPLVGQGAPIYETGGNYIHTYKHTDIHTVHAYIRW